MSTFLFTRGGTRSWKIWNQGFSYNPSAMLDREHVDTASSQVTCIYEGWGLSHGNYFWSENFFRRAEQIFCRYWIRLTRNARSGKVGSSHCYLDRRPLQPSYVYPKKLCRRSERAISTQCTRVLERALTALQWGYFSIWINKFRVDIAHWGPKPSSRLLASCSLLCRQR